jgi:hypothetical protein
VSNYGGIDHRCGGSECRIGSRVFSIRVHSIAPGALVDERDSQTVNWIFADADVPLPESCAVEFTGIRLSHFAAQNNLSNGKGGKYGRCSSMKSCGDSSVSYGPASTYLG